MKKIIVFSGVAYIGYKLVRFYKKAFTWRCKEKDCFFFSISDNSEDVFKNMQDHMRDKHNQTTQ